MIDAFNCDDRLIKLQCEGAGVGKKRNRSDMNEAIGTDCSLREFLNVNVKLIEL